MAMKPHAMRALTLASAKHLLTQGHISKKQHHTIIKKVKGPQQAEMPQDWGALNGGMNDTTSPAAQAISQGTTGQPLGPSMMGSLLGASLPQD